MGGTWSLQQALSCCLESHGYGKQKYKMIMVEGIVLLALSVIVNRGLSTAESDSFNAYCASVLNYFFDTRPAVPNLAFYISVMCTIMAFLLALFSSSTQDMKKGTVAACILLTGLWNWLSGSTPAFKGQAYAQNCIGDIGTMIETEGYRHIYFLDFSETNIEHYIPAKFLQYRLTDYSVYPIEDINDISAEAEKNYCILTCNEDITLEELDNFYRLTGKSRILRLYEPKTGSK